MSNFKKMKFRVKSPEHSEQIQKALFGLRYEWAYGACMVQWTSGPAIFAGEDGLIRFSEMRHFNSQNSSDFPEYELKEVVSYELHPVEKPETVELGGKVYLKKDLEEALSKIKPIGEVE